MLNEMIEETTSLLTKTVNLVSKSGNGWVTFGSFSELQRLMLLFYVPAYFIWFALTALLMSRVIVYVHKIFEWNDLIEKELASKKKSKRHTEEEYKEHIRNYVRAIIYFLLTQISLIPFMINAAGVVNLFF